MSQTTDDRKAVVRRCLVAWNDEDMETFDEVYARDLTVHRTDIDRLADLKELHATWYEAFPDLMHRVEEMVAEDDRVDGAYRENHERLVELKNEWDPENLFRQNSNVERTTGERR